MLYQASQSSWHQQYALQPRIHLNSKRMSDARLELVGVPFLLRPSVHSNEVGQWGCCSNRFSENLRIHHTQIMTFVKFLCKIQSFHLQALCSYWTSPGPTGSVKSTYHLKASWYVKHHQDPEMSTENTYLGVPFTFVYAIQTHTNMCTCYSHNNGNIIHSLEATTTLALLGVHLTKFSCLYHSEWTHPGCLRVNREHTLFPEVPALFHFFLYIHNVWKLWALVLRRYTYTVDFLVGASLQAHAGLAQAISGTWQSGLLLLRLLMW